MNIGTLVKKNKLLFLVGLIYLILAIVSPQKASQSGNNSMYYIVEMLQIMPVVFVLTSLIETWIPREVIVSKFGENSGGKGIFYSLVLGSLSAGPIYAAFPVCKMLLKKGASISNIVIILSSWAVIKVPMLANESKFLGIKFMAIRWVLTTLSILFMAYITASLVKKESIPFKNESEEDKKEIYIKEQYCIGCGLCNRLSPENFEVISGKAKLKNDSLIKQGVDIEKVIDKCPAKAIVLKQS